MYVKKPDKGQTSQSAPYPAVISPNDSPSQRTRGIAADAGGEVKDSVLPVLHGVLLVLHGVLPIPHGILRVAAPAVFKLSTDCLPGLHGVWQTL